MGGTTVGEDDDVVGMGTVDVLEEEEEEEEGVEAHRSM